MYVFYLRKEFMLNPYFYVQVVGSLQPYEDQSTFVEGSADSGILPYFYLAGCVVQLVAVLLLSLQWVLFPREKQISPNALRCAGVRKAIAYDLFSGIGEIGCLSLTKTPW
jgi:hypothetical protein